MVHDDGQGAVLEAGFNGMERLEDLLDLLRKGRGTEVPIMRSETEDGIANTATDYVGGVACRLEAVQEVGDCRG